MISETDLILNPDGSVYHLKLRPGEAGQIIFFVGDPERVPAVSNHFDRIELKRKSRELHTHTGYIGRKRVSCISTGMGTDNVDIVLNELDALFNIDFSTRKPTKKLTELTLIRVGTSGSIRSSLPVGSISVNRYALGLDSLMQYYPAPLPGKVLRTSLQRLAASVHIPVPQVLQCHARLSELFSHLPQGFTATCPGFYAPQGRQLRLPLGKAAAGLVQALVQWQCTLDGKPQQVTNIEMETAGMYGLAAALGHQAISVNAILANRISGEFCKNPNAVVKDMIKQVLEVMF